jgi:hypothetical protein
MSASDRPAAGVDVGGLSFPCVLYIGRQGFAIARPSGVRKAVVLAEVKHFSSWIDVEDRTANDET